MKTKVRPIESLYFPDVTLKDNLGNKTKQNKTNKSEKLSSKEIALPCRSCLAKPIETIFRNTWFQTIGKIEINTYRFGSVSREVGWRGWGEKRVRWQNLRQKSKVRVIISDSIPFPKNIFLSFIYKNNTAQSRQLLIVWESSTISLRSWDTSPANTALFYVFVNFVSQSTT